MLFVWVEIYLLRDGRRFSFEDGVLRFYLDDITMYHDLKRICTKENEIYVLSDIFNPGLGVLVQLFSLS